MSMVINGLSELTDKLKGLAERAEKEKDTKVTVGYTAAYSLYVHENNINVKYNMKLKGLPRPEFISINDEDVPAGGFYWDPHGQNKFLEGPARAMEQELADTIVRNYQAGVSLPQAMLLAGLKLQRASMQLVPVVTGNLKNSAFTRLDDGSSTEDYGGGAQTPTIVTDK